VPVEPVKYGRMAVFFTGKRTNGQRAQPIDFEYFESDRNSATGQKMELLKKIIPEPISKEWIRVHGPAEAGLHI
jgi:hypothetical protein